MRFAAIAVDAFGAGSSSAASDANQSVPAFPALTIRDMVNAQYRLLTDVLGVTHLAAVVGYSMGGMQALEWGVAYPTFIDRLVVIEGSPRLTASDSILWQSVLHTLESGNHGVPRDSVAARTARVLRFAYSTEDSAIGAPPEKVARQLSEAARTIDQHITFDDMAVQVRAMLTQDVASSFGGDMDSAARASRARLLVVASPGDRAVSQQPTLSYALAAHGDSLVVPSPCGHRVLFCERTVIGRVTREFLGH
jgi:homoserine O-acetyltransferase